MYKNGYYTTLLAKALSKYYENASFVAKLGIIWVIFSKNGAIYQKN